MQLRYKSQEKVAPYATRKIFRPELFSYFRKQHRIPETHSPNTRPSPEIREELRGVRKHDPNSDQNWGRAFALPAILP